MPPGEAIRPYFRQPLAVDDKADLTPGDRRRPRRRSGDARG